MAQFVVTVEGDELEELQEIVATIRQEQPRSAVTEQSYVEGLIHGALQARLAGAYMDFVKGKSLQELKSLLGSRQEIKYGK